MEEFVRESWEDPAHLIDYVDAVDQVGLWDSERMLVSTYFAVDDQILDIGCGAGRSTIALYRLGYPNIRGVDLSEGMVKRAVGVA
ncbi:MAG: class I SAM-dependent methyltransferase, partial [Chloroflexi bacterium]|nr:class I SAM-dependent methyltransferase [Chloroflexota bacterium]